MVEFAQVVTRVAGEDAVVVGSCRASIRGDASRPGFDVVREARTVRLELVGGRAVSPPDLLPVFYPIFDRIHLYRNIFLGPVSRPRRGRRAGVSEGGRAARRKNRSVNRDFSRSPATRVRPRPIRTSLLPLRVSNAPRRRRRAAAATLPISGAAAESPRSPGLRALAATLPISGAAAESPRSPGLRAAAATLPISGAAAESPRSPGLRTRAAAPPSPRRS